MSETKNDSGRSGPSELLRHLLEASANSPLGEADPASLDELMARIPTIFNKRPLETTDADIVDTVRYYRAKRAMFAQLAREKADKEPSKRTKKSPTTSSREIGL